MLSPIREQHLANDELPRRGSCSLMRVYCADTLSDVGKDAGHDDAV